jgi:hypothetical protein
VIVIGDAQLHGAGSAGVAGCTDASADPHGFNTATELAGMAAAQRTLTMIRQVSGSTTTSLACYQGLAAGGFTGGTAIDSGGDLAGEITSLISAAFANYNNVHLEVASASPAPASASWIAFSPASVGPVPAPSTQSFTLTATVPGGTPAGTYAFDVVALADGTDIGHQSLTIVVPERRTGAGGTTTFTFTNTRSAPGTNAITATDGPLSATAAKTFFDTPPSCAGVKLSDKELWPPNHKFQTITASGAADGDIGDSVTTAITAVTQDEPVNSVADGNTSPDAILTSPVSSSAQVRPERQGTGDGRVYRLTVVATDSFGATCSAVRTVGVPHDQSGPAAVDSAPPSYNSLLP